MLDHVRSAARSVAGLVLAILLAAQGGVLAYAIAEGPDTMSIDLSGSEVVGFIAFALLVAPAIYFLASLNARVWHNRLAIDRIERSIRDLTRELQGRRHDLED